MQAKSWRNLGWCLVLAASALLMACGEPVLSEPDAQQLKVLEIYPGPGEQGVDTGVEVVVVFSHRVVSASGDFVSGDDKFELRLSDVAVNNVTVGCPDPADDAGATVVVLTPGSPLGANQTYQVFLSNGIQGQDGDGKTTKTLGVDVISSFTTGQ
jgi:hypothetical protein